MNLLIRHRADLDDAREEYERDIAQADRFVQRALLMKKIKAERAPNVGGVPGANNATNPSTSANELEDLCGGAEALAPRHHFRIFRHDLGKTSGCIHDARQATNERVGTFVRVPERL